MSSINDDNLFQALVEKTMLVKNMLEQGSTPTAVNKATGIPLQLIYQLEREITSNAADRAAAKRDQLRKVKAKRKAAKVARKHNRG